jgi:hypothetical protein
MRVLVAALMVVVIGACGRSREETPTPPATEVEQEVEATEAVTGTPVTNVPTSTIRRARVATATANDRIGSTESAVDSILEQTR